MLCIPQFYDVTVAATLPAVTVAECKLAARIDTAEEDSQIAEWIKEATEAVEIGASICLLTQTVRLTLDDFPSVIELRRYPVQSVSSVVYVATDGTSTTMSASDYRVNIKSQGITRVTPVYNTTWPSVRDDTGVVQVTFVAGYTSAILVPATAKTAIKVKVAGQIRDREGMDSDDYETAFQRYVSRLRRFDMV